MTPHSLTDLPMPGGRPLGGYPLLYAAVALAFIAWFFLFAVPGTPFWVVIASATLVLGGAALVVYPDTLRLASPGQAVDVLLIGLGATLALYLVFAGGNILVRVLPFLDGAGQVQNVYSTRTQASPGTIGALLLFPIGPGEELFWRAWVQRALMAKLGPWRGFGASLLLYTGVHLPSLNITLVGAALVAGLFWGLLYMRYRTVWPGVVSHALWDAAVFVWFPFE